MVRILNNIYMGIEGGICEGTTYTLGENITILPNGNLSICLPNSCITVDKKDFEVVS